MLLQNKVAVIYGGGGAIGGAAARAFAREGARVFLAGRTRARLEQVAKDINDAKGNAKGNAAAAADAAAEAGRVAGIAEVDALDEEAVNAHADAVAASAGRIDIALNAVGILHVQGPPVAELSLADYMHPVNAYAQTHFITAKAVARHMVKQGSGVILTLSTPGARLAGVGFMGNGVASAAVEALSRLLAAEFGPSGVRVICLRPDAIPEAVMMSHADEVFRGPAARAGIAVQDMLAERARTATLLKRLPTLAEVGDFAAFVASDRASAMTGAIVNLTCGSLVD